MRKAVIRVPWVILKCLFTGRSCKKENCDTSNNRDSRRLLLCSLFHEDVRQPCPQTQLKPAQLLTIFQKLYSHCNLLPPLLDLQHFATCLREPNMISMILYLVQLSTYLSTSESSYQYSLISLLFPSIISTRGLASSNISCVSLKRWRIMLLSENFEDGDVQLHWTELKSATCFRCQSICNP